MIGVRIVRVKQIGEWARGYFCRYRSGFNLLLEKVGNKCLVLRSDFDMDFNFFLEKSLRDGRFHALFASRLPRAWKNSLDFLTDLYFC